MIETLKQHWQQLQTRERRVVLAGAVALVLIALYALAWEPYSSGRERLAREVTEQRALLAWMEQASREVQSLRGKGAIRRPTSSQSLMMLVDGTARGLGLAESVQRVQPEGERTVRLWLEKASFDDTVRLLDRLTADHHLKITGLVVERRPEAGRVDARIVLESGA